MCETYRRIQCYYLTDCKYLCVDCVAHKLTPHLFCLCLADPKQIHMHTHCWKLACIDTPYGTRLKLPTELENHPLDKEIPIGNHHFQVPCWTFGGGVVFTSNNILLWSSRGPSPFLQSAKSQSLAQHWSSLPSPLMGGKLSMQGLQRVENNRVWKSFFSHPVLQQS